jgi:hypothetical protein
MQKQFYTPNYQTEQMRIINAFTAHNKALSAAQTEGGTISVMSKDKNALTLLKTALECKGTKGTPALLLDGWSCFILSYTHHQDWHELRIIYTEPQPF